MDRRIRQDGSSFRFGDWLDLQHVIVARLRNLVHCTRTVEQCSPLPEATAAMPPCNPPQVADTAYHPVKVPDELGVGYHRAERIE